jgi:hypothetical protein
MKPVPLGGAGRNGKGLPCRAPSANSSLVIGAADRRREIAKFLPKKLDQGDV